MAERNNPTTVSTDRDFVITRVFDAPREMVFKAWTDPQHMAQWWGPHKFTNPVCELDVRPGGAWRIVMLSPDGAEHPAKGVYREVKPPERLVLTIDHSGLSDEWHDMVNPGRDRARGKPAIEVLTTVTFEEQDGGTKLTIRVRFESAAVRDSLLKIGMNQGWSQSLERLATELEANMSQQTGVKNEPLVFERTFDAPIATVWKAITDRVAMKQWYFDLKEFKPQVGFEFQFDVEHKGFNYLHRCVVKEVVAEKKLAYTWRYQGYEGDSLVTFELFAQGNKTRLRLMHTGLETFPAVAAFARENFVQGWTSLIGTSLKDFVEGRKSDTPGTADREIIISRIVDAPPELAWKAMTDPKHVVHWWGPRGFSTTIQEMDVRPGGVWKHTMRGPDGAEYPNDSIFKEVAPPHRLVYSHGGHKKGGSSVRFESTWTFDAIDGSKTRVTIHMLFPSAAERDRVVKEFGAVEGGKQTLERLAEYLPKM